MLKLQQKETYPNVPLAFIKLGFNKVSLLNEKNEPKGLLYLISSFTWPGKLTFYQR